MVKALLVLTAEAEGRRVIAAVLFGSIRAWSRSITNNLQLMSPRKRIGRRKIQAYLLWLVGAGCGSVLSLADLNTLAKSEGRCFAQHTFLWLVCAGCCKRIEERRSLHPTESGLSCKAQAG